MSTIKVNALRHTGGSSDNINLDSSRRTLIGLSTGANRNFLQIQGDVDNGANGVGGISLRRGVALGSIGNGSQLGQLDFCMSDGGVAARIICDAEGSAATDDYPGRLQFETTADGASSPTEAMRIDSSQNLLFNSGYGSVATAYGVRAWVNFSGNGTVAIRDDGNVSSITDNGTGDYDVNFTTAMPDNDYCVFGSCVGSTLPGYLSAIYPSGDALGTSDFRIRILNYGGSYYDMDVVSVAVIR